MTGVPYIAHTSAKIDTECHMWHNQRNLNGSRSQRDTSENKHVMPGLTQVGVLVMIEAENKHMMPGLTHAEVLRRWNEETYLAPLNEGSREDSRYHQK